MMGNSSEPHLISLTINDIFDIIQDMPGWEHLQQLHGGNNKAFRGGGPSSWCGPPRRVPRV
ncbi:hypothetical protein HPB50_006985 [Hyalomma asiaticum]|uniref:Uncharacterized protein n=1 Tax=Hyalomma asiaticum TaxID=266040 RepID=A0ACB7TGA3_HYAAI|nr:hypothetical protein HPB50_006985 [Hyalomma asiaticum]